MRRPGACHHARFMGKSIYVIKIFILSNVFQLSRHERQSVARVTQFVVLLYGRFFLASTLSAQAPRNDLQFWYDLKQFRDHDRVAADVALTSAHRHLWYLTPELVVFSLFDPNVPDDEKAIMATTRHNTPRPAAFQP